MQNINVRRYEEPGECAGWIEPDDKSWIAFVYSDGQVRFYLERDPETGAVVTPSVAAASE